MPRGVMLVRQRKIWFRVKRKSSVIDSRNKQTYYTAHKEGIEILSWEKKW